jgi:putative ABC transport system permease protein
MVALGTGVFTGFAVGCLNVFQSANRFYKAQNTYDIKIASTLGLTDDDLKAISAMKGVKAVFGSYSLNVKAVQNDGKSQMAVLTTLDSEGMNKPYVLKGTLPTKVGQVAVNSKYIKDTGLKLGDTITLKKGNSTKEASTANTATDSSASPKLAASEYKITAIILSPLDISNKEGSVASISFRTGSSDYMLYATTDSIKSDIYDAIYLTIDGAAELDCYSKEYQVMVDNMTSFIDTVLKKDREQIRYDKIERDAKTKIVESENLLADKITTAEKKLMDAQAEINDGWIRVKKGWTEVKANEIKLADGELKLADAQKSTKEKFTVSQKKIDNGRKELEAGGAKLNSQENNTLHRFADYEQQLISNQNALDKQESEAKDQLSIAVAMLSEEARQIWNENSAK